MEEQHPTPARARGAPAAWRAEARATLALALPLALTNLSQFALTLTNALILGHHSTEALAAGTIGGNLFWAVMAAPFGLALAAAPILAQARGAGRRTGGAGRGWVREVRRGFRHAMAVALGLALLCLIPLWHAEWLLREALGQDPALAALAAQYVGAMMWGLPPFVAFVVLRGFLAAMERPGPALAVALGAIAVNAVLCWALVFGAFGLPGLGIRGAGIASAVVDGLMPLALLALVLRDRRLRRFRLPGGAWRLDRAATAEALRVGLPIAGAMLLEIGVFSAGAMVVGWLGTAAVAAHAIAVQTSGMTFMVPMGVGQAATARVGLAAGEGDAAAAARAGWVAVALGAGFMAAMGLLLVALARPAAWVFLNPADPAAAEVAALGAALLMVVAAFQVADGTQAVAAGALRGLKDTRVPMLFAAFGYWGLGLPLGAALALPWGAGLGAAGLWAGLAVSLGVVAALMVARWRRLSRPAPAGVPGLAPRAVPAHGVGAA